jgi:hypothetical protein
MRSSANFRIIYDGTALTSHTLDVRELAPALLALGDLVESASHVLCGDKTKVKVEVKASFRTGSFGIDCILSQSFQNQVLAFFNSAEVTATLNATALVALLFGTGKGLVHVLKWLRGRTIKRIETKEKTATIIMVDEDRLEVEKAVIDLLRDRVVREEIARVLAPLEREGISSVGFGSDTEIAEVVTENEVSWFSVPPQEDILILEDVRKMAFSIISLAFKEDNKWRLHDGNATIHAAIADTVFLNRVDQNIETFAKNDILICQVRVKQWQTGQGAKTDYVVEKMLEHRQAARQLALPLHDATNHDDP